MKFLKRLFTAVTAIFVGFSSGCGAVEEISSIQPKAELPAIEQSGMSKSVPEDYFSSCEHSGTVTEITYNSKDYVRDESDVTKTVSDEWRKTGNWQICRIITYKNKFSTRQ